MLQSLAARLGTHPRRVLCAVLAFVVVAGLLGGPLAGSLKSSGGFAPPHSDSSLATDQLEAATGAEPYPSIVLLVATPGGAGASAVRLATVAARLRQVKGVLAVTAPAAVARDGRQALVTGTLSASAEDSSVAKATEAAFKRDPDVIVGGSAMAGEQISSTVTKDLGRAELLALPLLVGLSLLFFRGRAALMPVVVGIATVLGTFLALTAINHVYGLNVFALNLVIGLGLGLAVDYTLFLVTRFREELAGGVSTSDALAATLAHAGRTIVFSATTVACALATLIGFPEGFLKSMGIAGATVAIVAALGALTISPALMGLWGMKLARAGQPPSGQGRWYRFAYLIMRRPGLVAGLTSLLMLAAAAPALSVVWTPIDNATIPSGQNSRTVADAITREFEGAGQSPIIVAISAPRSDAAAVIAYADRVSRLAGITRVDPPRALGPSTWRLAAHLSGDPQGPIAQRLVKEIRSTPAPFPTKVAGQAAGFLDQQSGIASHLPLAIGLLAALTFTVLWLMTDSFVLPLKALVMNALTVGAALSPLVLIYQHGHLTGLLGYTSNGGVEPTDFLVAATVVFALSTDYGVFLLSRIKEARDAGAGEREAVAAGLGRSGRVLTAAAILLAVAIGAFSTSSISFIQQIGLATATGVLLDAFVVRSLLVPSLMALLGGWNWWAPRGAHGLRRRIVPAADAKPGVVLAQQLG